MSTEYEVGDDVLRRYPLTKIGYANPSKYGSWWCETYLVTPVNYVGSGQWTDDRTAKVAEDI